MREPAPDTAAYRASRLPNLGRRYSFLERGTSSLPDGEYADLAATIVGLLEGRYSNPIRVIAFNNSERWSEDVSEDIAHALRRRCDLQIRDVPSPIQDFVERHEGHRQLALGLV